MIALDMAIIRPSRKISLSILDDEEMIYMALNPPARKKRTNSNLPPIRNPIKILKNRVINTASSSLNRIDRIIETAE